MAAPDPVIAGRYSRLDAAEVERTLHRLSERIAARFPDRNLALVAAEVARAAREAARPRPRWLGALRAASFALMAVLGVLAPVLVVSLVVGGLRDSAPTAEWLAIGESAINDLVFAGVAIIFLWALPARIQRDADLRTLHRLRSLAHVVDVHQLTKDPDRFLPGFQETASSTHHGLDPAQLSRYLDYCSELLSLIGKVAAIVAESNTDATVLSGVQGVEDMTNGLSRKIWQKIALLPRGPEGEPDAAAGG